MAAKAPAGVAGAKPVKQPKLRVSYILKGGQEESKHCFGVNALASPLENPHHLYSGGRDSSIFLWDVAKQPQHVRSFSQHTDWVNDIFLTGDESTLVSASSDTTLKIWRTSDGACLRTLQKHTDYVKALAYARKAKSFASAGLDTTIWLWDLESATAVASQPEDAPIIDKLVGHKDSIYSLAMNSPGTRLVSGSTEKVIRVWDPRQRCKLFKLKGHTDNIKCLQINEEGTQVLSGGSDGEIRLWDLGQQRCVRTFDMHSDSVWTLAADSTFSRFFSGGRDKKVFATELATGESDLVFEESEPLLRLLYVPHEETLWATTSSPTINNWSLDAVRHRKKSKVSIVEAPKLASSPSSPSNMRPAPVVAAVDEARALVTAPRVSISGRAGITKYHILNNRREVLTKDTAGRLALWDVTKGVQIKELPGTDNLDETANKLQEMLAIANWFSIDTRMGTVMVHLDSPQCFTGECYIEDIPGYPGDPDLKLNIGERVLAALFKNWVKGKKELEAAAAAAAAASSPDVSRAKDEDDKHEKKEKKEKKEKEKEKKKEDEEDHVEPTPPTFLLLPDDTKIIVSDESTGAVIFRSTVQQLNGREPENYIPPWVADSVLRGKLPQRDTQKLSFQLLSLDEKEMPKASWKEAKLTAPRTLRIRKVLGHVAKDLKIPLESASASDVSEAKTATPEDVLELVCNKQVVEPHLTIGAVRTFVWKNNDDLVFYYRYKEAYLKKKKEKKEKK